jgi:6-phosphogluconolactonase
MMKRALLASLVFGLAVVPGVAADPSAADTISVYVGSYAKAAEPGIHHFKLDLATGALTAAGSTSGVANPSFVAVSPDKKYLYAIGEAPLPGKKGGAVASFSIDEKTGGLTLLSEQSSVGGGPCYVTADKTGKVVLVANYGGGSVASLPVGADGTSSTSSTPTRAP